LAVGWFAAVVTLSAQSAPTPAFEVVSVKPSNPGAIALRNQFTPTRVFLGNYPVTEIIAFAYNIPLERVVDGPDWIANARYDITGTFSVADGGMTSHV
jgi:uncharacterized protein (TIGR03435 family)